MKFPFFDHIWHIRGSVPLAPNQTHDEAYDRLMPLFMKSGTTHERSGDTLTFEKKDQEAQDKMSIFDRGVLQIVDAPGGSFLRYRMASRALLYCFLAPLLFLAFAQLNIQIGEWEKASAAAEAGAEEEDEKETIELPQNVIDKALGAPAPEIDGPGAEDEEEGPSPTPAYVFAGLFVALYLGGRILEDRLIKSLFRKRLHGIGDDKGQNKKDAEGETGSRMLSF